MQKLYEHLEKLNTQKYKKCAQYAKLHTMSKIEYLYWNIYKIKYVSIKVSVLQERS